MGVLISWKMPGMYKGISAEKCANEIGEVTTPEKVVEIARDEGTELHKCFEWNDTIAAEKYRVVQAREVLRSIVIRVTEEAHEEGERKSQEIVMRKYESGAERKEYKSVQMIVQNVDEHQKLIAQAKRELESFRKRYEGILELAEVLEAIDNIL